MCLQTQYLYRPGCSVLLTVSMYVSILSIMHVQYMYVCVWVRVSFTLTMYITCNMPCTVSYMYILYMACYVYTPALCMVGCTICVHASECI